MDNIDLKIIRLLTRDSRTPYKNIVSAFGITPSATIQFKKISLLGNVIAYSEELDGSYIFGLYVKDLA